MLGSFLFALKITLCECKWRKLQILNRSKHDQSYSMFKAHCRADTRVFVAGEGRKNEDK